LDRSKLPIESIRKLAGRTWIALAELRETDRVSIVIGTKPDDLNCLNILESKGYQLFSIYQNATNKRFYTVMRRINKTAEKCSAVDIINLSAIECVLSIEIGTPLAPEQRTKYED
jgi:hypothetical protein